MPVIAKPEILSPSRHRNELLRDENLDTLSHLLDDFIRIPGTPIRFGLDGIVGFIPGIGDIVGGLASCIIIVAAWMRGVPKVLIARMVLNVAVETLVGAVPVFGNLFDIGWRANRRNYALLTRSLDEPGRPTWSSWLFIILVCVALLALVLLPIVLFTWILVHIQRTIGAPPR